MNTVQTVERVSSSESPYCPFESLNPVEYYGLVTDGINFNQLADLSRALENINLPKGVLIATCGSDGKLEQHAQSKTELIIIEERSDLNGEAALIDYFGRDRYCEIFDSGNNGHLDVKAFDSSVLFSCAFGDRNTTYPDRVLNTHPLHPLTDEGLELYFRAREKALVEMTSDKHIRDSMKTQLREYKRSMRTGEFRRIPTFDTLASVQYYSEQWPGYTVGFKSSFLRATQRKIDLLTLSLEGKKDWREVAVTMPTTTLGRLNYLAKAGIISGEDASQASEAYAWFLQRYHHAQEGYKQSGAPIAMSFDSDAFAKYSEDIDNFVTL